MKKLIAVGALIAVMGAGCSATGPAPTTSPLTPDNGSPTTAPKMSMAQFMTGSWKIKSMQTVGGEQQDVSSLELTLVFDGEKMSGKVCNSMNGPYTVEDDLITFGPIVSTKMFCEGLPGKAETAFTKHQGSFMISKNGENLTMIGSSVFVLERQGPSVTEDAKVY